MNVTLNLVQNTYWGMMHVAYDVRELNDVVDLLVERGIVSKYATGIDFMMAVDIEVDGDIHTLWSYQDTTGISGRVDKDLLEYACEKAGIEVEIKTEKAHS